MHRLCLALALLIALLAPGAARAQPTPPAPTPTPLEIGLVGSPPFVVQAPGTTTGMTIELWESVARDLDLSYRYRNFEDLEVALKAVRHGEIDVLVGPLTITAERATMVAFTEPYFRTSLGIASGANPRPILHGLQPLLTRAVGRAVVVLLLVLFVVGLLIWLAERSHPETQFPRTFRAGVGEGMWLAITTMSTVGYGDRFPITNTGRWLCGIWMLVSLVAVSSITAVLATTFTVAQMNSGTIHSAEQLAGRPVAVVRGSIAVNFALEHQALVRVVADLDDAMLLLRERTVDAVVHDRPMLAYFVKRHPDFGLRVSSSHYQLQDYGLALPLGSSLIRPLNVALLRVSESGEGARLENDWIGE